MQQSIVPALDFYRKHAKHITSLVISSDFAHSEIVEGFRKLHGGIFVPIESATAYCFSNFVFVLASHWMVDSLAPFARDCIISGCNLPDVAPQSEYDVLLYRRAHEDGGSLRSVLKGLEREGLRVDSYTLNSTDTPCVQYAAIHSRARTPAVITIHGMHEIALLMLEKGMD